MYCVFHPISGHLPRQIWFWKISIKTWASVWPPCPLLGQMPNFFRKWISMAPHMYYTCNSTPWRRELMSEQRDSFPKQLFLFSFLFRYHIESFSDPQNMLGRFQDGLSKGQTFALFFIPLFNRNYQEGFGCILYSWWYPKPRHGKATWVAAILNWKNIR